MRHQYVSASMRLRALGRFLLGVVLFLMTSLLVAEGGLQIAARLFVDRSVAGARAPGTFRVLALGDSHTYGAGVSEREAYPGQLQEYLDAREPGVFTVINKGVPGFNTSMLRKRLARHVSSYDPDMVILWVGINDIWNVTDVESDGAGVWARLEGIASRSRLFRLVMVWRHDRRLERDVAADHGRPTVTQEGEREGNPIGSVGYGDFVEKLTVHRTDRLPRDTVRTREEQNFAAMVRWLRGAGIPVVFIEYPLDMNAFATANEAMRTVAARYDVPIVHSPEALMRLPKEKRQTLWAAHPNADMYHEIVLDLGPLVLAARDARNK
jgi:lysophospholipase L1-like esterase